MSVVDGTLEVSQIEEVVMTVEPTPTSATDLSAPADVETLLREVPKIVDADDLATDGIFDSDDEVDDFLRSMRSARDADIT